MSGLNETMSCVQRRETLGLPPGDTDPFYDTLKDLTWQVGSSRKLSSRPQPRLRANQTRDCWEI